MDARLRITKEDLLREALSEDLDYNFPGHIDILGTEFSATYRFSPGAEEDGVTITVPMGSLEIIGRAYREGILGWIVPGYLEENTDAQRGQGVFEKSLAALRRLNALGYGQPNSPLQLTLVYNPLGPSLPPSQSTLEAAYRRELARRYGIVFHRLYTITNMPISRFLEDLLSRGQLEEYMQKLIEAYNPAAAAGVMCRTTLSVGWDGRLYDCDFNQMLQLGLAPDLPQHIREADPSRLAQRRITTGQHCYGCTAGNGSSCQGAVLG
jgi:radical SAM/Cys-rich protein